MKVAFTSTTGEMIDQHFGMAESFCIWEVGPEESHFVETVQVGKSGDDEEDKIASRVGLLTDCAIVYTMQIGGPAAAKVVSKKIHPMKTGKETSIAEIVEKLEEVLRGNPPPWLRKAMNKGKGGSFVDE
jgi:nitrogen fixation protein NifX